MNTKYLNVVPHNPERYCGWFWIHCSPKKFERTTREAMDVCLRELKESNKSRFDSYSVRNGVLIISHITFRGCGVDTFSDNLSWNSCMHSSVGSLGTDVTLWRNTMTKIFDRVFALERTRLLARTDLLLTPMQQVLTALRLFTTRTFEQVIGDLFGVSVLRSSRSLLHHG